MELNDLAIYDIVINEGTVFDLQLTLFDDNDDLVTFPPETQVFMKLKFMNTTVTYEGTYEKLVTPNIAPVSSFFISIPRTEVFAGDFGTYQVDYATPTDGGEVPTTKRIIRGDVVVEHRL